MVRTFTQIPLSKAENKTTKKERHTWDAGGGPTAAKRVEEGEGEGLSGGQSNTQGEAGRTIKEE